MDPWSSDAWVMNMSLCCMGGPRSSVMALEHHEAIVHYSTGPAQLPTATYLDGGGGLLKGREAVFRQSINRSHLEKLSVRHVRWMAVTLGDNTSG